MGFFFREGNFATRSLHAVALEDRFGLILMNLHQWPISARICVYAKPASLLGTAKGSKREAIGYAALEEQCENCGRCLAADGEALGVPVGMHVWREA
jgi:hypothetical protein